MTTAANLNHMPLQPGTCPACPRDHEDDILIPYKMSTTMTPAKSRRDPRFKSSDPSPEDTRLVNEETSKCLARPGMALHSRATGPTVILYTRSIVLGTVDVELSMARLCLDGLSLWLEAVHSASLDSLGADGQCPPRPTLCPVLGNTLSP